jgi:16S rRNA (guanine527-N7)-methyltransferase
MVPSELERISCVAKEWSVDLTAETAARLGRFCAILLEWNKRVNLTGATSLDDLLAEHLPDSFIAARLISEAASVVDIGAGGGLPGIPLAILRPDCKFTLVEPRGRRVAFLNTAARLCGCGQTKVIQCRSEEMAKGGHDVAMSRATFAPETWLELGRELVGASGHVLSFSTVEVASASMRLAGSVSYRVGRGVERWVGLFDKT